MLPELLISKLRILYLHSRRRYLINSIPLLSIVALLVGFAVNTLGSFSWLNNKCYANSSNIDRYASMPIASISLSNSNMISDTAMPGSVATVNTDVSVSVENAESYALILKVDNVNLVSGSTILIPGDVITSNTWGYKWSDADSYITPSVNGTPLDNLPVLDNDGNATFTKTLTFGAKFSNSAEMGTYHASGILTLVTAPKNVVNPFGVETMQEMTPTVCQNANENDTYQLRDTRDNKYYWVTKLKDGNCWMTQNLALELDNPNINSENTDITGSFPSMSKVSNVSAWPQTSYNLSLEKSWYDASEWILIESGSANGYCSLATNWFWSCDNLSKIIDFADDQTWTSTHDVNFTTASQYTGTDGTTSCSKKVGWPIGKPIEGSTVCSIYYDDFMMVINEKFGGSYKHHLLGNYYTYQASLAGTGVINSDINNSENASGSICPKNWFLPRRTYIDVNGSYAHLFNAYGFTMSASPVPEEIYGDPMFFIYSGSIGNSSYNKGILSLGSFGLYRASTQPTKNTQTANHLFFQIGPTKIEASGVSTTTTGMPVRCLARF